MMHIFKHYIGLDYIFKHFDYGGQVTMVDHTYVEGSLGRKINNLGKGLQIMLL